jgi:hypothetical protein
MVWLREIYLVLVDDGKYIWFLMANISGVCLRRQIYMVLVDGVYINGREYEICERQEIW